METLELVKKNLFATQKQFMELDKKLGTTRFSCPGEGFWGIDIGDNQFIFANNIIEFMPHRTWGRVAYHKNKEMDIKLTIEFLKKSHDGYLKEYFPEIVVETKKTKSKGKKTNVK